MTIYKFSPIETVWTQRTQTKKVEKQGSLFEKACNAYNENKKEKAFKLYAEYILINRESSLSLFSPLNIAVGNLMILSERNERVNDRERLKIACTIIENPSQVMEKIRQSQKNSFISSRVTRGVI